MNDLLLTEVLTNRSRLRLAAEEHMSTITVPSACGGVLAQELEKIFREHAQLMYRSAFSVTGSRQDAEDVLQNIFLKLLQREVPLEFRTNPRAYLYRAAVNRALDVVRSRKRQNFTHDVEDLAALEAPQAAETVPDDPMRRCLLDAIAQLRPRAVEILILHYEHNYTDAEIAKILGKSRGTIAVTLYRTRARLKRLMSRAPSFSGGQQ
jgi:RNA polymerase sigma factor (sigma-70 family)